MCYYYEARSQTVQYCIRRSSFMKTKIKSFLFQLWVISALNAALHLETLKYKSELGRYNHQIYIDRQGDLRVVLWNRSGTIHLPTVRWSRLVEAISAIQHGLPVVGDPSLACYIAKLIPTGLAYRRTGLPGQLWISPPERCIAAD